MLLIKNVHAYMPDNAGVVDILIAGTQIVYIGKDLVISENLVTATIDARGLYAVPGFIDGHVHTIGGGGEGGFATRTPELQVGVAFACGVTTVIGVLGTDGIARSMETLIAKTYGLRAEGLSAYCLSGSYHVPLTTLTGELTRDIMFIDPVLGAGEIAIGDHRSNWPRDDELLRVIADARLGGILSGKAGIVNIHLGDDIRGFEQLERIFSTVSIPRQQVLPTHCNRT
ncbi:MAG TPA: beta-aspartyl-peptidase, partial [Spirochaetales bacterium]|nr:beta-aspartyl-peptidase [Spirochaetales bacterium]